MSAFWSKEKKKDKAEEKKPEASKVKGGKKKNEQKKKEGKKDKLSEKPVKKDKKMKKKAKKSVKINKEKAHIFSRVLIKPKVSENSMAQQSIGKYSFIVAKSANKYSVKEAIEAMYGVVVEKVNIVNYSTRAHNFRGRKGKRKGIKKAIVSLRSGDTIELFKEVK
jgi:large subunit ribosomal protein L23